MALACAGWLAAAEDPVLELVRSLPLTREAGAISLQARSVGASPRDQAFALFALVCERLVPSEGGPVDEAALADSFADLAKRCGLQARVFRGWAKGAAWNPSQLDGPPNHSWNAVEWGGQWHLVDCAWGAGGMVAGRYRARLSPVWFDTPAFPFYKTHLLADAAAGATWAGALTSRARFATEPALTTAALERFGELGIPLEGVWDELVGLPGVVDSRFCALVLAGAPPDAAVRWIKSGTNADVFRALSLLRQGVAFPAATKLLREHADLDLSAFASMRDLGMPAEEIPRFLKGQSNRNLQPLVRLGAAGVPLPQAIRLISRFPDLDTYQLSFYLDQGVASNALAPFLEAHPTISSWRCRDLMRAGFPFAAAVSLLDRNPRCQAVPLEPYRALGLSTETLLEQYDNLSQVPITLLSNFIAYGVPAGKALALAARATNNTEDDWKGMFAFRFPLGLLPASGGVELPRVRTYGVAPLEILEAPMGPLIAGEAYRFRFRAAAGATFYFSNFKERFGNRSVEAIKKAGDGWVFDVRPTTIGLTFYRGETNAAGREDWNEFLDYAVVPRP
ncbi:MAG: hypothetical protein J0L75_03430 [Spirochaetes bacterium]|nr:hypothetical protein [Spirochaetota bacterium]